MTIEQIIRLITYIVTGLLSFQILYQIIGFFFKSKKFAPTEKQSNYAIVICARNEEKSIALCIDSIRKQTYPADKITIFATIGNSTDRTAEVARELGAIVYEEPVLPFKKRNKGMGLKHFFECIARDYADKGGVEAFDGWFSLDSDCVLAANYVEEMNKAFQHEEFGYITNYGCSKNFGKSFISSYSGLNPHNKAFACYRPQSLIGASPVMRGNSHLIRSHLLKDGWKWAYNSEDFGFSFSMIAKGVRATYVESAKVYEEGPDTFKMLLRQRIRWFRGIFCVWLRKMGPLFLGIFWNKSRAREKTFGGRLKSFFVRRWSCYDGLMFLSMLAFVQLFTGFIFPLTIIIYNLAAPAHAYSWWSMLRWLGTFYGMVYAGAFGVNLLTIIREHRNIRCSQKRLWLSLPFWPFINIFFSYVQLYGILKPTRWKSIARTDKRNINEVEHEKTLFASKPTDLPPTELPAPEPTPEVNA